MLQKDKEQKEEKGLKENRDGEGGGRIKVLKRRYCLREEKGVYMDRMWKDGIETVMDR